jgi:hypothetical protein
MHLLIPVDMYNFYGWLLKIQSYVQPDSMFIVVAMSVDARENAVTGYA